MEGLNINPKKIVLVVVCREECKRVALTESDKKTLIKWSYWRLKIMEKVVLKDCQSWSEEESRIKNNSFLCSWDGSITNGGPFNKLGSQSTSVGTLQYFRLKFMTLLFLLTFQKFITPWRNFIYYSILFCILWRLESDYSHLNLSLHRVSLFSLYLDILLVAHVHHAGFDFSY